MKVPEIIEVKNHLDKLKTSGLIESWELPYENLLTRRSAAIFFVSFTTEGRSQIEDVWDELGSYENFSFRANEEKKLSDLNFRLTFNKEEKEKNRQPSPVEVSS